MVEPQLTVRSDWHRGEYAEYCTQKPSWAFIFILIIYQYDYQNYYGHYFSRSFQNILGPIFNSCHPWRGQDLPMLVSDVCEAIEKHQATSKVAWCSSEFNQELNGFHHTQYGPRTSPEPSGILAPSKSGKNCFDHLMVPEVVFSGYFLGGWIPNRLVVWNIFHFPIYWESSQLTNIFQRGSYTTNQPSNLPIWDEKFGSMVCCIFVPWVTTLVKETLKKWSRFLVTSFHFSKKSGECSCRGSHRLVCL